MKKSTLTRDADLQSILLEISFAMGDKFDRDVIRAYMGNYPDFATDIAEFAAEWLYQEVLPECRPPDADFAAESSATAVFNQIAKSVELRPDGVGSGAELREPFDGISASEFRRISKACDVDTSIMVKLCDRLIEVGTIPLRLIEALARQMGSSTEMLVQFLAMPPRIPSGAEYKATTKPQVVRKESFADAVRLSSLEEQRKRDWLKGSGE